MDTASQTSRLIAGGVAIAFALLIAAVWASGAGTATSLALTGVLILVGGGVLTFALGARQEQQRGPDRSDEQRERMERSTP